MLQMLMLSRWIIPALLSLLVIISLGIRIPMLKEDRPFFYHEDEAHHFNRLVDMVKQGTFNPRYFHKPSLHFYLRMPAVYLGMALERWSRPEQTIAQIKTHDRYGLAKYSFSWSHPMVVMAVRSISLLLVTLTLLLVYGMARELALPSGTALTAAVIYLLSPEVYRYSGFIGVDVPLMFFCCLASYLALHWRDSITTRRIWIVGIAAGLAVSCKYNGAPIAALPLLMLLAVREQQSATRFFAAIAAPILGFFAGSPYILLSFDLFYKQLSYEAWHYAVAGHEGHTAEPGIAQIVHYSRWLMGDGIGLGAALFVPFGLIALFKRDTRATLITASFPLIFFALMSAQRVNFERNMLPIIPYCAIFAASLIFTLTQYAKSRQVQHFVFDLGVLIVLMLPQAELRKLAAQSVHIDTRIKLEDWAHTHKNSVLAVDGELQPHPSLLEIPGVSRFGPPGDYEQLFQSGVDVLALSRFSPRPPASPLVYTALLASFDGDINAQRVIKDPAIDLLILGYTADNIARANLETLNAPLSPPENPDEPYRWISKRISKLHVAKAPAKLSIEMMTPWQDQQITLKNGAWQEKILLNQKNPGEWITVTVEVPQREVLFVVEKIKSPAEYGLNADTRRLGVALRRIEVE